MSDRIRVALAGAGADNATIEYLSLRFGSGVVFVNNAVLDDSLSLVKQWCDFDAVMYFQDDDTALNLWVGHPHLRYIKKDNALKCVKKEIKAIVKNIELEKKWLIKMPDISQLYKYPVRKIDIEQVYLLSDVGSHRIRKRGFNSCYAYFETLKMRLSGDKAREFEGIIDENRYNELMKKANPQKHPIIKNRFCLLYKGQYFELDVFPFWEDRALLELEICSRSQEECIELPPELKVIKDVSKEKKYKNNYLASINYENN